MKEKQIIWMTYHTSPFHSPTTCARSRLLCDAEGTIPNYRSPIHTTYVAMLGF